MLWWHNNYIKDKWLFTIKSMNHKAYQIIQGTQTHQRPERTPVMDRYQLLSNIMHSKATRPNKKDVNMLATNSSEGKITGLEPERKLYGLRVRKGEWIGLKIELKGWLNIQVWLTTDISTNVGILSKDQHWLFQTILIVQRLEKQCLQDPNEKKITITSNTETSIFYIKLAFLEGDLESR